MSDYDKRRIQAGRDLFAELRAKGIELKREPTLDDLAHFGDGVLNSELASDDQEWLWETLELTEMVMAEKASVNDRRLFWVRVGGTLIDLPEPYRKGVEGAVAELLGLRHPVVALQLMFLSAMDTTTGVLSIEERVFLQWRRNVECHPRLHHYRTRLQNGKLDDVRAHRLVSEPLSQAATQDAIESVQAHHNHDDAKAAFHFATALHQPLLRAEKALRPLCEAADWAIDQPKP